MAPMTPEQILQQYFGYASFRPGQKELIGALMAGEDCLGVLPTGAGKSICYQVPALLKPGLALVISPLISLMKDQVDSLTQIGVAATFVNSFLTCEQIRQRLKAARAGHYRILYLAPERLEQADLLELTQSTALSLVIVDEAHCVSHWGHDFRPSYAKIGAYLAQLPKRPAVGAFTATATSQVRTDISASLNLRQPKIIVASFDRPNLYFGVEKPKRKLASVLAYVKAHAQQSGIIYCLARKNVELVHEQLVAVGIKATRYHAGLSDAERRQNQEDFIFDRTSVMVATNAFGMGVNKSNVSYVLHYNMPKNLESYYQEAGRAGRDGEAAECLLYYAPGDVRTNQWLIEHDEENHESSLARRQTQLQLLKQMTFYCHTNECLRAFIMRYFGDQTKVCCDNCSNCQTTFETHEMTEAAQKIIACVLRLKQRGRAFGKMMIINILRGSQNAKIKSWRLETLSTYGLLKEMSLARVHYLIDYLIEAGYLVLSTEEYPVVLVASKAIEFLKQKQKLILKIPREREVISSAKEQKLEMSDQPGDEKLWVKLKILRTELATAANVPPYIIFSNATLREMCFKLPQTESAFLEVSGVGETKLKRYGAQFIRVIKEHLQIKGA